MPEDAATDPNGAADGRPRGPSLTSILRFKWTILAIFALIAAPAIAAVWILIKPEYTAMAEVRVPQMREEPLGGYKPITGHRSVMNTQVPIIRSLMVLRRVLDQTDVQQTSWYRDPPRRLLAQTGTPMERLRDALSVRPRGNTEIIGVSFASLRPREAELILNATLDQYKKSISERSDRKQDNVYRRLTDRYKSLENEIAGREKIIARISKELGTGTPTELVSRKRVRLDEAQARLKALVRDAEVLSFQLSELRKYDQESDISGREIRRIRFIEYVSRMSAGSRRQLHKQLEQRREGLGKQIGEAGALRGKREKRKAEIDPIVKKRRAACDPVRDKIAKLKKQVEGGNQWGGASRAGAKSGEAKADTDKSKELTQLQTNLKVLEPSLLKAEAEQQEADTRVREATMRLEILRSKLALAGSQLHELTKVMARFGDSEAAPTTQSAAKPRYEEDAEWRGRNVAVTRAQHRVEEAGRDLTDLHPDMVKLIGRLDLAKRLRRTREVQLDRLWERRAEGPSRNGKTAREEALQDLARLDRDMPPVSSDASGAGSPLVGGMPVEQQIKLVRQRLKLTLHEKELLEKDVMALYRDFRSTFDSARLLEKETRELGRKRRLFSDVRESLEEKDMERNVPGSIEVLTRAFSPSTPSKDRRIIFTFMAVFGALGAGMAVGFLRASTSQAMHGADDLPRPLRAPFLGQLPLVRRGGAAFESNPLMVENMRMIRTALLSRMDEQRGSTVMIGSANTGAGKSTVAVMLGRSLAEGGKKVLLIDADLRRSTLSHHFGLDDEPGLLESLTRRDGRQQTVFPTDTPRLSIMPTGQRQGSAELELMANGVFSGFVGRLSKDYDIILLDSSPILPVADARIVSRHVDGTIMVVREETSRRGDVIDALACLGSAGGKLLGTIFIGTLRGDRYGYDYYYSEADA